MQLSLFLTTLLTLLAAANPITKRAGGPAAVPIPSTCTVVNPLPDASSEAGSVNSYLPKAAFTSAHELYSTYFSSSLSTSDEWTQCSEQCYGYGTVGTCKSAILAYNAPTPEGYYGTEGGVLETACLFYDDYLTTDDLTTAPEGQYTDATAGSIYCDY